MAGVEELAYKGLMLSVASCADFGTIVSLLVPAVGTLSSWRSCMRLLMALYFSDMNESPSIWYAIERSMFTFTGS